MRLLAPRRRSFWVLTAAVSTLVCVGGALYSRVPAQETRTETEIAPGVSLLSVSASISTGPLRYWLVKADPKSWRLALEVADARDIIKKRSTRNLAKQSGALVAINGGFFAYGGAAVGAVKVDGDWHRLPWKTRTALAWNGIGESKFGALAGNCELEIGFVDETRRVENAALNGFSLSGSHAPLVDGFAVLTSRFAPKYKIKANETGAFVDEGQITTRGLSGEVSIPERGFLLIARGNVAPLLALPTEGETQKLGGAIQAPAASSIKTANWKVVAPRDWDNFPHILGAGPRLVNAGQIQTTEKEEEFRPDVIARGPRTAIGRDADGNWLFLVLDGRQVASVGLTLPETAQLFHSLGAVEAMNLDGGSSTQLVVNGELVNVPSGYDPVNPLRPREVMVSNALVLKAR